MPRAGQRDKIAQIWPAARISFTSPSILDSTCSTGVSPEKHLHGDVNVEALALATRPALIMSDHGA